MADNDFNGRYPSKAILKSANDYNNWVLSLWGLLIACNTMFGGRERWAGEPWAIAREVPGSPASWGVALALGCLIFSVGHMSPMSWQPRSHFVGAGATLVWCWSLAFCMGWAYFQDPYQISGNGPITYFIFGLMFVGKVAAAAATVLDRDRPQKG